MSGSSWLRSVGTPLLAFLGLFAVQVCVALLYKLSQSHPAADSSHSHAHGPDAHAHAASSSAPGYAYSPVSSIAIAEMIKCCMAGAMLLWQVAGDMRRARLIALEGGESDRDVEAVESRGLLNADEAATEENGADAAGAGKGGANGAKKVPSSVAPMSISEPDSVPLPPAATARNVLQATAARLSQTVTRGLVAHMAGLAFLYFVNNQLSFVVLLQVDTGTLSLFKSFSTLIAAVLLWLCFAREVLAMQWLALLLQVLGLVVAMYNPVTASVEYPLAAYLLLLLSVCITAVCSVWNEYVVKNLKTDLMTQNIVLYAFGASCNVLFFATGINLYSADADAPTPGFFEGYSGWSLLVIASNGFMGVVITAVYKYADAIIKTLATACATAALFLLNMAFFGMEPRVLVMVGVAVVFLSSALYFQAMQPPAPAPAVAPAQAAGVDGGAPAAPAPAPAPVVFGCLQRGQRHKLVTVFVVGALIAGAVALWNSDMSVRARAKMAAAPVVPSGSAVNPNTSDVGEGHAHTRVIGVSEVSSVISNAPRVAALLEMRQGAPLVFLAEHVLPSLEASGVSAAVITSEASALLLAQQHLTLQVLGFPCPLVGASLDLTQLRCTLAEDDFHRLAQAMPTSELEVELLSSACLPGHTPTRSHQPIVAPLDPALPTDVPAPVPSYPSRPAPAPAPALPPSAPALPPADPSTCPMVLLSKTSVFHVRPHLPVVAAAEAPPAGEGPAAGAGAVAAPLPEQPSWLWPVDLLLSSYIFPHGPHDRWAIFTSMLRSIGPIPFQNIYLFLVLDAAYEPRKDELLALVRTLWPGAHLEVQWSRWAEQADWQPFMHRVLGLAPDAAPGSPASIAPRAYWLLNNDDHIFVDFNIDLVLEGIELVLRDVHESKDKRTVYLSHHPEIMLLAGKLQPPARIGNFVKFNTTIQDAILLANSEFIRWAYVDYKWAAPHARLDGILIDWAVSTDPNPAVHPWSNEALIQTMYVPLREMCRKAKGYDHVGLGCIPPITTPLCEAKGVTFDPVAIENLVNPINPKCGWNAAISAWSIGNPNHIPDEWLSSTLALYEMEGNDIDCLPWAWCGKTCSPKYRWTPPKD